MNRKKHGVGSSTWWREMPHWYCCLACKSCIPDFLHFPPSLSPAFFWGARMRSQLWPLRTSVLVFPLVFDSLFLFSFPLLLLSLYRPGLLYLPLYLSPSVSVSVSVCLSVSLSLSLSLSRLPFFHWCVLPFLKCLRPMETVSQPYCLKCIETRNLQWDVDVNLCPAAAFSISKSLLRHLKTYFS